MELNDLKQRWDQLMVDSGVSPDDVSHRFADLCCAYSEPHRQYHTLTHLQQMFDWLSEAGFDDVAGRWAVWYHDYVYTPGRQDNESESARIMSCIMKELGIIDAVIVRAAQIIDATRDHKSATPDAELDMVLDADMAILGVAPVDYSIYCQQVRCEFSHVADFFYRQGRKKFLKSVLREEKIYQTKWFSSRFEKTARSNVNDEIQRLMKR